MSQDKPLRPPKARPQGPASEFDRLALLSASIGEHFKDFVVLVRTENGLLWRSSDSVWGGGACWRYLKAQDYAEKI